MRKFDLFELKIENNNKYENPFFDVEITVSFISPSKKTVNVMAFYDGANWRARFVPSEVGRYEYFVSSYIFEEDFNFSGEFVVEDSHDKGFVEARPDESWGLFYNNGDELLVIGDTMYNLFGVAYCGVDIEPMLKRRKEQGFNLLRVRIQTSPYHPGTPYSGWCLKNTWLWGGTSQIPDFTRFNTDYFESVEETLRIIEKYGFTVELILEAWLMEYPFNNRKDFLPEYEELFINYVVSRLSSFKCISMWTVANEYNLYAEKITPKRDDMLSVRFANRLASMIAKVDAHNHPIAAHVTAAEHMKTTFKQLFEKATDIDVLLMQYWGDISDKRNSQMCFPMESELERSVIGSGKVNVLSEYGYEVYPGTGISPGAHDGLGEGHTRRGAWRAVFTGVHVTAGFENTWGPVFTMDNEPVGADKIKHLSDFFKKYYSFEDFRPSSLEYRYEFKECECQQPLQLKSKDIDLLYFPEFADGQLELMGKKVKAIRLFNTATGEFCEFDISIGEDASFANCGSLDSENNLQDIVLAIER